MSIFITFEGGEGSGKSTQAKLLEEYLKESSYDVVRVHEPGGTDFGNEVRRTLLDWSSKGKDAIDYRAQVLGFCSARAQLVSKVIIPRLNEEHTITISDRYADSTVAYQVFGSGKFEERDDVIELLKYATRGTKPIATFYLDISIKEGLNRVQGRLKKLREEAGSNFQYEIAKQFSFLDENYFEAQDLEFHSRVRRGYEWLISNEPERWIRVKATGSVENVFREIKHEMDKLIIRNGLKPKAEKRQP